MLTKDLLRVSRAGGGYHPQFVDDDRTDLAARAIGIFQGHVGEPRERLTGALTGLEHESDDFKLVRGLAKLLEREATFETRAAVEPRRARRAAFEAAETVGVVTDAERQQALTGASERIGATVDDVEASLYADRETRQILTAVESRWTPEELIAQYNLSLAQTALFDATEIRVRSSDPKALVSAVKRLRLMYEIRQTEAGREVVVTGPTALFQSSRRYGTRFARLLRTVAKADEWHLTAAVDDRGTERELRLQTGDVAVPGVEPVTDVTYDSGVESEFATRFQSLDTDWRLRREPEPLAAGAHVVIPDFAFEYDHADFTVFFEIVGFWTPEYVEKKLDRLAALEDVEMVVAVDESLGVGEELAAQDHRVVTYRGGVRIKDVRNVLRRYERDLASQAAEELPDELTPDADVVTLAELAEQHGVSEDALAEKAFPDHERVGRTLVRPAVLDSLAERIGAGDDFGEAERALDDYGIDDASAALSHLGYRVEWTGLSGGTVVERREDDREL